MKAHGVDIPQSLIDSAEAWCMRRETQFAAVSLKAFHPWANSLRVQRSSCRPHSAEAQEGREDRIHARSRLVTGEIMNRRLPYSDIVIAAAVAIARKTVQQRGVRLINKRGVQCVCRTLNGEALPILSNQSRRWS